MKNEMIITGPDAQYRRQLPSLRDRLMRGTAARLCPTVGIISTQPVIVNGSDTVSPVHALRGRMVTLLGPLYVLFLHVLQMFGQMFDVGPLSEAKRAELDAINDEAARIAETAQYWQHAIAQMLKRADRTKAKGRPFTAPDWFIWLSRFDVSLAPSRLKAIMAAGSIKGRVAIMALCEACSEILRNAFCTSLCVAQLCQAPLWPD